MSDKLLSRADQQEALSRAYAQAVAARAGYVTTTPDIDRDSIDLRISAGGAMRPALELQLKASTRLPQPRNGHIRFELKKRNYDHLIEPTQTPRLLMVLDLPPERNDWMTINDDRLILRRRAYWISLLGEPESKNTTSVTISIPTNQRFDVPSLRRLMDRSRSGKI